MLVVRANPGRKGIFGLGESPRQWYLRFKRELEALGFLEIRLMRCFFMIFHDGTKGVKYTLRGVLVIHVDDTLAAGDITMEPIWAELRTILHFFGSRERVTDTEGVYFCGRFTTQD